MRVSLAAWLDPQFWRWAAWFWLNSLMPGWANFNHQSHRYGAATGVLDDVDQGVSQVIKVHIERICIVGLNLA